MQKEAAKFYNDFTLKQHEARCQAYIASYNATIEFSKSALRGSFILNGMAAVALLYSPKVPMSGIHYALLHFALGTLFAVICSGLAYITQFFTTDTWYRCIEEPQPGNDEIKFEYDKRQKISAIIAKINHYLSIICIVISYCCFGVGTYFSYKILANL